MRFAAPEYLILLIAPVFIFAIWWLLDKKRIKIIESFFSKENIISQELLPTKMERTKAWAFRGLCLIGFAFLILSLSRPQYGQRQKSMLVQEHSVVFLIDLSRSMLTRDISPSRLHMVKQEIFKALKLLAEVRVGLVVFAGSVDVISPMTSDLDAIESYVESLGVDSVSSQGTQIRVGLEEAKALFERSAQEDSEGNKLIILFSDGETHESESLSYAESLTQKGYSLFTVGVGTESGGYVPEEEGSSSYIRDQTGQAVVSKPNFNFLKELASAGSGAFYYLSPLDPLGPKIKKTLSKIEGVAAARKKFVVRNEVFQFFIIIALLCFTLSLWVKRF